MTEIYSTEPRVHRSGVTAVDVADPADTGGAVHTKGYHECRFDLDITGTGLASLEVQALFWNPRQGKWFGGGRRTYTAAGQHALVVDSKGAIVFLKVTAFSGTSFSLSADYTLS